MIKRTLLNGLFNSLLVLGSIAFLFLATEAYLRIDSALNPPPPAVAAIPIPAPSDPDAIVVPNELIARANQRRAILTLPEEWKFKVVQPAPPGSAWAYTYQGLLFTHNQYGMRPSTPFPQKQASTFRVLIVGDSLTYGAGIEEKDRFSNLLDQWMRRDYRIEFLNLGISGAQSEDILKTVKQLVPELKADLVIYAMCLNDFLPSGAGEYHFDYAFPIPKTIQQFFFEYTRTGVFLSDLYDRVLRTLHYRRDFFDDILNGFGGYEPRFRHDVAEMNTLVQTAGLPPMIAMVVDQYPNYGSRGYQISLAAERAFQAAHIDFIPMEDYYRRYNGQSLYEARWEGHPDEVANFIWATMLMKKLQGRKEIEAFKR